MTENGEREDPFEVLLENVVKILDILEKSEGKAKAMTAKRKWQVKRVRKALNALNGVGPVQGERTQAQIDGARRASETRKAANQLTRRETAERRAEDREEATVG